MNDYCTQDLWDYLAHTSKTIVMYGMGNGADKILAACAQKGITVSDFFASDGFVRGHMFHGKTVLTWSAVKEKYGADAVIVLLSFGTSRPEVLENIWRIAAEAELYAPDVPAFGDGLFDVAFYRANREKLAAARELFADEESLRVFDNVVQFKLTGDIRCLAAAESERELVMQALVCPREIVAAADLGAYNGDTVRELLDHSNGNVKTVYALEPDARNYRKLEAYAAGEKRAKVRTFHVGAWFEADTLYFDGSGNRNASFGSNRSETLAERPVKMTSISADTLDHVLDGAGVDYIKYDVEGAEKEALLGSAETIGTYTPTLLVSLYHRNEDIFELPLMIREKFPQYSRFYLRRFPGIPAWDLNLYCKK